VASMCTAGLAGRLSVRWAAMNPDALLYPLRRLPARVASAVGHLAAAQVVVLTVIPQATTQPNQTGLTRNAAQPDLARPNWTVENRRLAVIS
jgi:hypothetical protein